VRDIISQAQGGSVKTEWYPVSWTDRWWETGWVSWCCQ